MLKVLCYKEVCQNIKEILMWIVKSGILYHYSSLVIIWNEVIKYKGIVGDVVSNSSKISYKMFDLTSSLK